MERFAFPELQEIVVLRTPLTAFFQGCSLLEGYESSETSKGFITTLNSSSGETMLKATECLKYTQKKRQS